MTQVANYRLAPAKIQLFVREIRNDPTAWPYLRHASHEAYNDCVADGAFYYGQSVAAVTVTVLTGSWSLLLEYVACLHIWVLLN